MGNQIPRVGMQNLKADMYLVVSIGHPDTSNEQSEAPSEHSEAPRDHLETLSGHSEVRSGYPGGPIRYQETASGYPEARSVC